MKIVTFLLFIATMQAEYCNDENMENDLSDSNDMDESLDLDLDSIVNENEDDALYDGETSHASSSVQFINKDDPRSRLHFVKYTKREGKTQKIWECGICSKEFRHQYTLMRHLPTHTDERNFKCDICGKAFRQLSTLSQHKAIHSDARPYICEYCKKTFNRVSTLISHRKTHSENKPHKCHLCGKGFHQKGNLRNHVFTHTNERPYKCERCGKGFNQMSNLVCHKFKAHADVEKMQYSCSICNEEFPRRFTLRAHEEYKHGIKYRQSSSQVSDSQPKSSKKSKSVRIVRLPENHHKSTSNCKPRDAASSDNFTDCIMVDKINTKAMENAVLQKKTPFALLKSAKDVPILVKILSTSDSDKHCLLPATPEDLQETGNIGSNSTLSTDEDGIKTLQVKVPIVACIVQNIDVNGEYNYVIEAPKSNEEQEDLVTTMDPDIEFLYSQLESSIQAEEPKESNWSTTEEAIAEDCNELLELAAQGGIKFVRATDDGRYEVITDSEARELMVQQNSHDIRILEGEEADAISELHRLQQCGDNEQLEIQQRQQQESQQHEQRQEQQCQEMVQDFNSSFVVMDSSDTQEAVLHSFNDIEYLDHDKNVDHKTIDEQFIENIAFLSQESKMDDFIICPKTFEIDGVLTTEDNHDIIVGGNKNQSSPCLFSHRDEFPSSLSNLQSSISTLLDENQQHTIPMLDKTPLYSYSKNVEGLNENPNVWSCENEQSAEKENRYGAVENSNLDYSLSSKLEDDVVDSVAGFSQSEIKNVNNNFEECKISYDDYVARDTSRIAPDYDMFGSKNLILNDFMMSYPEIKFLDDFPRFSKGTPMSAINFGGLSSSDFDEMEDILMNVSFERDKSEDSGFIDELSLSKILDAEKSLC